LFSKIAKYRQRGLRPASNDSYRLDMIAPAVRRARADNSFRIVFVGAAHGNQEGEGHSPRPLV
jgi:hypothetical protein